MNLASRSIVVPELFHHEHAQVGLLLRDWLVFFLIFFVPEQNCANLPIQSLDSLSVLCLPEKQLQRAYPGS